jgi:hypothetical protein
MNKIIYGVVTAPPTQATALAFGSDVEPVRMMGGQGTAYRAGNIVLKPAGNAEEEFWSAELFEKLPASSEVRFARPIKSVEGTWIYEHYVAWTFLQGDQVNGRYDNKLVLTKPFPTTDPGAGVRMGCNSFTVSPYAGSHTPSHRRALGRLLPRRP